MLNYDKDPKKFPVIYDNILQITNFEELHSKEASLVALRQIEIGYKNLFSKGKFDLAKWQAIHKFLFQDIYPWAGKLRDVDISKGGVSFCHWRYIDGVMSDLSAKMAKFDSASSQSSVAQHLAFVSNELNVIHPFREGNGRSKRVFLILYAKSLGYRLNLQNIPPEQLLKMDIYAFATDDLANMTAEFDKNLQKLK